MQAMRTIKLSNTGKTITVKDLQGKPGDYVWLTWHQVVDSKGKSGATITLSSSKSVVESYHGWKICVKLGSNSCGTCPSDRIPPMRTFGLTEFTLLETAEGSEVFQATITKSVLESLPPPRVVKRESKKSVIEQTEEPTTRLAVSVLGADYEFDVPTKELLPLVVRWGANGYGSIAQGEEE